MKSLNGSERPSPGNRRTQLEKPSRRFDSELTSKHPLRHPVRLSTTMRSPYLDELGKPISASRNNLWQSIKAEGWRRGGGGGGGLYRIGYRFDYNPVAIPRGIRRGVDTRLRFLKCMTGKRKEQGPSTGCRILLKISSRCLFTPPPFPFSATLFDDLLFLDRLR